MCFFNLTLILLILNRDPTPQLQNQVKKILNDCNYIFADQNKNKLVLMNPSALGLVKLHKQGNPIRPVISGVNSPTKLISSQLVKFFHNRVQYNSRYSVINSLDLISKLTIHNPQRCKLVSFDVSSMFTNIPREDCIIVVKNILDETKLLPILKNEYLDLLKLCTSANYFTFSNKIYSQTDGLQMGDPLSPLLANLFMDHFEQLLSQSELFKKHITFWYRYVDDVLAGFVGTDRQLNNFLKHLNSLHPKIKFTLETEKDNKINFLDLTIYNQTGSFSYSIYRKDTFSDAVIPANSFSPWQHKLSAFHAMIYRWVNVPMNEENKSKELNIIKQIANDNGFRKEIIEKLIKNHNRRKIIQEIFPVHKSCDNSKFVTLPFVGALSNKTYNYFKKFPNINIAYKPSYNLGKHLFNAKDPSDRMSYSGVYKLVCPQCPAEYIGQTGRSFNVRLKEHIHEFHKNKDNKTKSKSNFANHLILENHNIPNNFKPKILHIHNKSLKLNLLESLEIKRSSVNPNNLNDILELYNSPLIIPLPLPPK